MTINLHNDRLFAGHTGHPTPPVFTDWRTDAACAGLPTNLFVPDTDNAPPHPAARALCRRCPVRNDCLEHALTDSSLLGLWGGTTVKERQALRRQRGIRMRGLHNDNLAPCGTATARRRHQRRGETCLTCNVTETT